MCVITGLKALTCLWCVCVCVCVCVRDSLQSPQSPATTIIRSQSPEFWFPTLVTCNQDTIQKHAPSSHSLSGLPLTTPNWHQTQCALTCVCLPFRTPTILPLYSFEDSCCSWFLSPRFSPALSVNKSSSCFTHPAVSLNNIHLLFPTLFMTVCVHICSQVSVYERCLSPFC